MRACAGCGDFFRPSHHAVRYCGLQCKTAAASASRSKWLSKNRERVSDAQRAYAAKDPDRYRSNHYRKRYGLGLSELEAMLEAQAGQCGICGGGIRLRGVKGRDLAVVDHCHLTSKVRGLLCTPCNLMIGYAADDASRLTSAVAYLKRSAE